VPVTSTMMPPGVPGREIAVVSAIVRYVLNMFERAHQTLMMALMSGPFGVL
jgi:hypothetical protein